MTPVPGGGYVVHMYPNPWFEGHGARLRWAPLVAAAACSLVLALVLSVGLDQRANLVGVVGIGLALLLGAALIGLIVSLALLLRRNAVALLRVDDHGIAFGRLHDPPTLWPWTEVTWAVGQWCSPTFAKRSGGGYYLLPTIQLWRAGHGLFTVVGSTSSGKAQERPTPAPAADYFILDRDDWLFVSRTIKKRCSQTR